MAFSHLKRVMGEISKARERDYFTDCTLVCGAEKFPVHKVIVCSQSKVLHAAFSKPFREAASGEYELLEQSPAMVRRMVDYFYTGDYEDGGRSNQVPSEGGSKSNNSSSEEDRLTPLRLHAQMFALADMYQVDHLQSLAVSKYGKELERGAKMQDLLGSIPDVYQLTPSSVRSLRDRAVVALRVGVGKPTRLRFEMCGDQGGEAAADTFLKAYDEIAAESPEFLKDLLGSYIRAPLLGRCSHCAGEQPQPAEPLQIKCLTCGKGGARLVG